MVSYVDRPDGTVICGAWDYRHNVDDYLGRVGFGGKSVLEIGPASGYLTVAMEKRGAHVTAIETPVDLAWEYVPRVTEISISGSGSANTGILN